MRGKGVGVRALCVLFVGAVGVHALGVVGVRALLGALLGEKNLAAVPPLVNTARLSAG